MPRTVLAIGGHIGDMDLTAGPTLAKMIMEGDRAVILACTYGERGHPRMAPDDYRVQKVREGEQFAADIGAEFRVLDYSDGFLPDDDHSAGQVNDVIREVQPDIVITHWTQSMHRDHERAAQLAARGRFLAALPLDDQPRAAHSVGQMWHAHNWEDAEGFEPDTFISIPDEAFDRWRGAIQNQAFARGETYGFRYIDYYSAMMEAHGCLAGQRRACVFRVGGHERWTLAGP